MAPKARMKQANAKHDANVTKRGVVSKPKSESSPVGPYLVGLFVFLVCGSAIVEIFRALF